MTDFKSPYPYFGGKSTIAPVVWSYLGDTPNYVEPFLGSAACLLARPGWKADSRWIETVNDKDGFIANFCARSRVTRRPSPDTLIGR